jgi:hypothetical protein
MTILLYNTGKIYLQNPEKTEIAVFDNENQIGSGFAGWESLDENELNNYNSLQLKKAKMDKFKELQLAYYANIQILLINITFNGRTEYLELTNQSFGIRGLQQAKYKIENDIAFSETSDLEIPLEYQGIERMYYIYVTEFSRNNAIDVIVMNQSKKQELIDFFTNAIAIYTLEYDDKLDSDGNNISVKNYVNFFEQTKPDGSKIPGFRKYKEQLDALTTIEEVKNFTFEFLPLTITMPEEYIQDVQYNDYY